MNKIIKNNNKTTGKLDTLVQELVGGGNDSTNSEILKALEKRDLLRAQGEIIADFYNSTPLQKSLEKDYSN